MQRWQGRVNSLLHLIDLVNERMGVIVAPILYIMMAVVLCEVALRWGFNRPTLWAFEGNRYLLCALVFLAGGYTLWRGGHVRVDFVYNRFSPRGKAILDLVTSLLFFAFCVTLVWKGAEMTWHALVWKAHSDSAWGPLLFPVYLLVPLGSFLLLLQGLAKFIRDIFTVTSGTKENIRVKEPV